MLKTIPSIASRTLRGVAFAAATLLATAAWAATTAPAQVPLVSRVASPPPANVMITIDDSGSMQANFMPEVGVTVNKVLVSMPVLASMGDMIDIWYGDKQTRTYSGFPIPKGVTYADPSGTNTFQRQMRSSAINSIFYNPAVQYRPWLKTDGLTRMGNADYKAAWWDPVNTGLGTTNLSVKQTINTNWCPDSKAADCTGGKDATYDPALYYTLHANADPTDYKSYDQYDLNDGVTSSFPSSTARLCTGKDDSAGCCKSASTCTLDEERANFANWFSYYRTRTLLMKGAMSEALSGQVGVLGDYKLRVGWGTINTTGQSIDGSSTDVVRAGVRNLDSTQLTSVLKGIQGINPYGSTPLRQATRTVGEYFRRTDSGSPWRTIPGNNSGQDQLACRRSFNLMTTDGYYNDSPTAVGNVDGTDGPTITNNPSSYSPDHYVASKPYSDTQSNMLADYAMYYYVNDLQSGLDNIVGQDTKSGDLAFWQHLSMFTVGLGVTGQFNPVTDLPALTNGTKTWDQGDRIDDLWHAALDTHGMFFSAKDVVSLTQGLNDALGSAGAAPGSGGGASVSSTTLSTSTFKYVPGYTAGVWSGSLKAYGYDAKNELNSKATWDAATLMPAAASRNIHAWDGSASTSVPFVASSMTSTLKSRIDPSTATQDNLINYIRGDQTNEGVGKTYRRRSGILGDFTDSPPTFVQNVIDLAYDNVSSAPGYRGYLATKAARQDGMIFEGANDGMLHVFNGTTGVEQYAYVPYAVMPNLANYASNAYGSPTDFHQDFVDGPQVETDAFIGTKFNSTPHWSNLVLGSFGGGAPGFYALDVTPDSKGANTFDDRALLWEINNASSGANGDVGYISSRIAVGVLPNGSWKAFVGNGAYSANGNAVLLVVDLASGHIDPVKLGSATSNGLMGVGLVYNSNKEVVAVYAGDLQGNLWRVDFSSSGTPTVGFSGQPLFRAVDSTGAAQPIVAAPAVYPRAVGSIVLFGTGKLIDLTDADSTTPQSFYGVWDPTPAGAPATSASPFAGSMASNTQRSQLTQQTISPIASNTAFFEVTSNDVDFVKQLGWYMDLTPVSAKQRVIYAPLVLGQWVLINTMAPGAKPTPQSCDHADGTSAYFLLPAENGASPQTAPVWDTNGDGAFDSKDAMTDGSGNTVQAAGYSIGGSGGDTSVVSLGGELGRNLTGTPGGSGDLGYDLFCVTNCKIKNRVWRQLMTPPF